MSDYLEYRGMSYEAASREAERLIKQFGWYHSFDRLAALREAMQRSREAERNREYVPQGVPLARGMGSLGFVSPLGIWW